MKILLVNPPLPSSFYSEEFYVPSGLAYLAAVLRDAGHGVRLLDMNTQRQKVEAMGGDYEIVLQETIHAFAPDLIGLGCLFSGHFPDVEVFSQCCKRLCPDVPVMTGGIHFTIHARAILENCPSIDWIVLGEGEETVVALVEQIISGQPQVENLDGIAYRDGSTVVVQPKTEYIQDVDRLPFPAYDLLNLSDYYVDTRHWHNPKGLTFHTSIPIISSRSCPNRCSFCSMYMTMGPRWRMRSAANVVDEIELLVCDYGQTHFSFMDDNFTFNKERTLEICAEIQRRALDIQFETPNGLSMKTLDADVLEALVGAGMVRVSLAIESGSDYIRNQVMKKHLSRERILEVIHLTKQYPQLFVKAFFVIGMPEETLESLEETYQMIEAIDVDRVYIQNVVPFAGTEVFAQAIRDDLLVDVNPDRMYRSEAMYTTNYNRFFIKPYALELDQMRHFRCRCESLIEQRRSQTSIQAIHSKQKTQKARIQTPERM